MPFETKAKMLAERLSRNVAGEFQVAESGRQGGEIKSEEGETGLGRRVYTSTRVGRDANAEAELQIQLVCSAVAVIA